MSKKLYILYDGRACGGFEGGTDDATVFGAGVSKHKRDYDGSYGECACYSYDVAENNSLINEQWEWDYYIKE